MTNEEAITKLTNVFNDDIYAWPPAVLTAFGMAVDALKGADHIAEVSKKGDTIYRADAIDAIGEDADWCEAQGSDWQTERKERDFQILIGLPSAQPEHATCYLDSPCEYQNSKIALPSAQPELIRCGECKHSEHWYRDKARCFLWVEEGIDVFEDGFCNYAERKEGTD